MPDTSPPRAPRAGQRDARGADAMRVGHDSGAFGDKVAAPDPATAPLGTDDEASGVRTVDAEPPPGPATRGEAYAGTPAGTGRTAFVFLIAVLAVAVAAGIVLLIAA
jgi:hypothetical protein